MKFIAIAVLASAFVLSFAKKVPIDIYIEAMCKYSKQFMILQLKPTYPAIKDSVEVNFYTHGKSQSYTDADGDIAFRCQHGPIECERNKLQTCGLDLLKNYQDRQVAFIVW
jgi:interferon, gamma-inducible protein 30